MITIHNLPRHELIGLFGIVVSASNPAMVGIEGTVVDETKSTVVIETARGCKRIPKKGSIFRLHLPDGVVADLDGSAITVQPERRITMRIKD